MRITKNNQSLPLSELNPTVSKGVVAQNSTRRADESHNFLSDARATLLETRTPAPKAGLQRGVGNKGATELGSLRTSRLNSPRSNDASNISTLHPTKTPGNEAGGAPTLRGGMSVNSSEEASGIAADLHSGSISADRAVARAERHVETMRASGASPESIQSFYNQLALETQGNPWVVNSQGGQSYQSGRIGGETPGHVFQTNISDAFARRANQAGIESRMTEALGRPVDTNNLSDVRAYMDHVSRHEGVNGVQRELGDFLTNFYTHGHATQYSGWTNSTSNANTIQTQARRDGANRRIMDCDGYASIANELTRGIHGGRYNTQFVHTSGTLGGHALLTVEDRSAGRGFVVDNNEVGATYQFPPNGDSSAAARQGAIQSLNRYHTGQEITSRGLGLGSDINEAFNNKTPVVPATP